MNRVLKDRTVQQIFNVAVLPGDQKAETLTRKKALISFPGPESYCGLRGYIKREVLPKEKDKRTVEGSGRQKTSSEILIQRIRDRTYRALRAWAASDKRRIRNT